MDLGTKDPGSGDPETHMNLNFYVLQNIAVLGIPLQVVLHGQSAFPIIVSHTMFQPIRDFKHLRKVPEADCIYTYTTCLLCNKHTTILYHLPRTLIFQGNRITIGNQALIQ